MKRKKTLWIHLENVHLFFFKPKMSKNADCITSALSPALRTT